MPRQPDPIAPRPDPQPPARARRTIRTLLATVVVLACALGGALAVPHAAAAAEIGPGYQQAGKPLNHLGGYRTPNGTIAYCIEAGLPSPVGGATTDRGVRDRINGLGPVKMQRLGVVLARHGATTDNRTAAAVAMTVWSIADAKRYAAAGGDSRALRRAPESQRARIAALAKKFRAEAAAYTPVTPRAELRLTIDEHDERRGFLEVELDPASASATVELEGAVFGEMDIESEAESGNDLEGPSATADNADDHTSDPASTDPAATSTTTSPRARVSDGDRLPITAVAPDAAESWSVSASSDDITVTGIPSSSVRVFATPRAQTLVAAAPPTAAVASATAADVRDRRVPLLSTLAQPTAVAGSTVRDVATLAGVPVAGLRLTFAGYLQPADATEPVCTDETVIYRSTEPSIVDSDGEFPSEEFATTADHVGTIFWIATASTADGVPLAVGACGDPAEITTIAAPPTPPAPPVETPPTPPTQTPPTPIPPTATPPTPSTPPRLPVVSG
ncbi:hypothetical protein [Marisediminicola sp. LYQ134]|uniref:hypothetical protein n=1 Tax=Marisediminicola sp. LYQ134 TaxID=3391061 RepID=UPI003983A584